MKIHLISKNGIFNVVSYNNISIECITHYRHFHVPIADFKCMAGGKNNFSENPKKIEAFLAVVKPTPNVPEEISIEEDIAGMVSQNPYFFDEEEMYHPEPPTLSYETLDKYWRSALEDNDKLLDKLRKSNRLVYSLKTDYSDVNLTKGVKFIIQQGKGNSYRLCFDPYQLTDNFHSSISDMYQSSEFYTINGGWINMINGRVILYKKSGDYGVYDDAIAIECAKALFPNKTVLSFAGKEWEDIEETLHLIEQDDSVENLE